MRRGGGGGGEQVGATLLGFVRDAQWGERRRTFLPVL